MVNVVIVYDHVIMQNVVPVVCDSEINYRSETSMVNKSIYQQSSTPLDMSLSHMVTILSTG